MKQRLFVWLAAVMLAGAPLAAAAQPVTIVTFGDSGPAGSGVTTAEAYPAQLEAALRAQGIQATVVNISTPGNTTTDAVNKAGQVPANAKLVIIEFGSNDLRANVDKARMDANLEAATKRLRANGSQVILMGTRGLDYSGVAGRTGAVALTYPASFRGYISASGRHLTPEGHRAAVALMMPTVLELLKR
ncbi:MAG: GDSL-type esterase/lipase family protein [Reyranella sp.]|uniref:GDSL-type esterase/lipase family protein n=1 Tax=Reyranella sp. TaxID=1929291 RepID=UPI002732064E|nr:GDSL-type esterase/lipase family protein [Reyranella sp.]MDP1961982.1 GDSL-type esterase/lipase family protein [Reyranella sp.]MDP2372573.1 GDSL-type esterase/lipase family protein [Reyranella sp.]